MSLTPSSAASSVVHILQQAKAASHRLAMLSADQKNQALETLAHLLIEQMDALLAENAKDLAAQEGQISASLYQRLKLDAGKLTQLAQGVKDVAQLPDPVGRVLQRTLLDDGLVLEKQSVPLGVIGIIFESRPDVIPQILSLILKSGNAVVFKGGSEAAHSNRAMMWLVQEMNARLPWLPVGWASLLESREAVGEMLQYPQYVDLVIPRGSNQLVQSIMAATRIPVLGHADGVCHLYVHPSAKVEAAIPVILDAKCQYPAACNALETLLVDVAMAQRLLPAFAQAAEVAQLQLKGCERTRRILPQLEAATEADWRTEYGEKVLSIRLVDGLSAAVEHINEYGSHHTDVILAEEAAAIDAFVASVDSACVFANASNRFADGFRFGFGAEIGISTAKTHARGPVGLEGLVIYKYIVKGSGQVVADYVGAAPARQFLHQPLPCAPAVPCGTS